MLEALLLLIGQNTVNSLNLYWTLFLMIIIGIIIIWVVGALIFFIPATVIAGVVWFLTGNPDYAGLAFLLIAVLSILKK
jgi:hypothetical protein